MAAESGTGHDTAGWVGLQRPTRVAHAPEPDPAADPVVSPADTIRRARSCIAALVGYLGGGGVRPTIGPLTALADLADALLAVGERDKAEREMLMERAAKLTLAVATGNAKRERDRQQIARLTEALERLEPLQQRVLGIFERNGFVFRTPLGKPDNERTEAERWEKLAFTLYSELCEADTVIRAVLAGEEDARP